MTAQQQVEVHPVSGHTGAEIRGVDLTKPLADASVATIRAALLQWKVVFFRNQHITPEQQVAFARRFGQPTPAHPLRDSIEGHPEVLPIDRRVFEQEYGGKEYRRKVPITPDQQVKFSRYFGPVTPAHPITNGQRDLPELKVNNLRESKAEYAARNITVDNPLYVPRQRRTRTGWHVDITFVANPASISLLRGFEIPAFGGDTVFANLEALYESLSPALRTFLDTLQAIHVRSDHNPEPRFDGRPPGPFAAIHPLVTVHPETGKKILFLSGFIQAIHGLRPAESDALLSFLNDELSGRVELQYRYRWTQDSIVVWDNRAVMHAGPVDAAHIQGNRIVHRTTIGGELTHGPDGFVSRPLVGELFNAIS